MKGIRGSVGKEVESDGRGRRVLKEIGRGESRRRRKKGGMKEKEGREEIGSRKGKGRKEF